jgi:hypothetical protein
MYRAGVVLDSVVVASWVARAVLRLRTEGFLQCAFLAADVRTPRHPGRRLRSQRRSGLLYRLYERFDYALFKAENDALAPVDVSPQLATLPVLRVPLAHGGDGAFVEAIDQHELDVLIWFASSSHDAEVARRVPYGVWRLSHGDGVRYSGDPPFFWEIYDENAVAAIGVDLFDRASGSGRSIYRSYSATDAISLYRVRNKSYWKAANFFARRLATLEDADSTPAVGDVVGGEPRPLRIRSLGGTPSSVDMFRYLLRIFVRSVKRQIASRLYEEKWVIGWRRRDGRDTLPHSGRFEVIVPPRNRSIMDPFILHRDGNDYIFCEDYSNRRNKGVISYLVRLPNGSWSEPVVALSRTKHLSYPFIFEFRGDVYMIPETASARRVELHRALSFPDEWVLERVLISDVFALDATLFEHDGKFWLFASVPEDGAAFSDEVSVFYADSLWDEWSPHPMNPVVSDVRSARPAGRVFRSGDDLIRPSQDCAKGYGYAVVYNRIDVLTQSEYHEHEVGRLDPGWLPGNLGTHSYDRTDRYEVVDARRATIRFPWRSDSTGQRDH